MSCPIFKIPMPALFELILSWTKVLECIIINLFTSLLNELVAVFSVHIILSIDNANFLVSICSFYLKKYRYLLSIEWKEISSNSVNDSSNFY